MSTGERMSVLASTASKQVPTISWSYHSVFRKLLPRIRALTDHSRLRHTAEDVASPHPRQQVSRAQRGARFIAATTLSVPAMWWRTNASPQRNATANPAALTATSRTPNANRQLAVSGWPATGGSPLSSGVGVPPLAIDNAGAATFWHLITPRLAARRVGRVCWPMAHAC